MSDAFAYLSVLLSIVLGLAIAEVLQGYGTLLRSRSTVKFYAPPVIWSVMMLILATHFWWASFGLAGREDQHHHRPDHRRSVELHSRTRPKKRAVAL